MTPFSIVLASLMVVVVICIAIIVVSPACSLDDKEWGFVFGVLVAAAVGAGILIFNWDDILVSRADKFMLTRDAAYACADLGPSSCKKSILEWQKDSTWYADKVSVILKNIKETK